LKKIAIIPARGGSKRISKKNIKDFLGKPIIFYSINAAIESGLFDEIMVSTDDEQIAEFVKCFGAKVPFLRSKKNSDDFATTIDVIEEVISEYEKKGDVFDYTCCIYPCAPFVTSKTLKQSYFKLVDSKLDCVFPIVKYGHPIQRALKINSEGLTEMIAPENMQLRSQDLESRFHDLGQFYFFNTKKILKERKLWTNNTGGVEVSEMESHDIDTIEDWHYAAMKYEFLRKLT
jgi:pseudaminic acid cytidylyltransferase